MIYMFATKLDFVYRTKKSFFGLVFHRRWFLKNHVSTEVSRNFGMMSLILSKDIIITKCPSSTDIISFNSANKSNLSKKTLSRASLLIQ